MLQERYISKLYDIHQRKTVDRLELISIEFSDYM